MNDCENCQIERAYSYLYQEAGRLAADNARLAAAVKKLLAAVDFTVAPNANVRVLDPWNAADALQTLQELTNE